MEYLPAFISRGATFGQVLSAVMDEVAAWREAGLGEDGIQQQLFVDTATWGLKLWEELVGIPTDEALSADVRRAAILARLQGFGSMTPLSFKAYIEKITGREIQLTEIFDEYRLSVRILGETGIPGSEAIVENAIEQVKPAHLAVTIVYAFMTWRYANDTAITWGSLEAGTWQGFRNFGEE